MSKTDVVTAFRRTQILEAARERFLAGGLKATTVSQIATAAGVAKGTVYLYFPSKDAVLHQILSDDLTQLRDETLPAIEADGPLEDRLRGYFAGMVAFYQTRKDFIELCHVELGLDLRRKARRQLGDIFARQQRAWCDALAACDVPPARSAQEARTIVRLGYGLAMQQMRGWLGGSAVDDIDAAARLVGRGVRGR
jgi:AcrR family transcriptional regulator